MRGRPTTGGCLVSLTVFKDFDATAPNPAAERSRYRPVQPKPQRLPPDEQDFRSIIDVMERHGQRLTLDILGKARRRWLERPPRDVTSPHPNRLADVLAKMVADGVLQEKRRRREEDCSCQGCRYGEVRVGGAGWGVIGVPPGLIAVPQPTTFNSG